MVENLKSSRPFIDYYDEIDDIPTSQDISNIEQHVFRRDFLYRQLGIPLKFLEGRSVLEFGPGGGHNARATCTGRPRKYVLVDASSASLRQLRQIRPELEEFVGELKIIDSDIFSYRSTERYDLVIIEGTIPGQEQPAKMLRNAATHVGPSGTLISTTISVASALSELCRRLFRVRVMSEVEGYQNQVAQLATIFDSHLQVLGQNTRPIGDWVKDVILHDWHKGDYAFDLIRTLEALGPDFTFYHVYPRIVLDGRWYKSVKTHDETLEFIRSQSSSFDLALLDNRVPIGEAFTTNASFVNLKPVMTHLKNLHEEILLRHDYETLPTFISSLQELIILLPEQYEITKHSIQNFVEEFPKYANGSNSANFESFQKWWGRGSQYVSATRLNI